MFLSCILVRRHQYNNWLKKCARSADRMQLDRPSKYKNGPTRQMDEGTKPTDRAVRGQSGSASGQQLHSFMTIINVCELPSKVTN
jgi:hypothetical protein